MKNKLILVFGIPDFSSAKTVSNVANLFMSKLSHAKVCKLSAADYFDFSFKSINTSLKKEVLSHDYTICDGTFSNDLYPEKFFDIVCRNLSICADLAVLVLEAEKLFNEKMLANTVRLINEVYHLPLVVCVKGKSTSSALEEFLRSNNIIFFNTENADFDIDSYMDFHASPSYLYDYALSINSKIQVFIDNFFNAASVNYSLQAKKSILILEENYNSLPIYFKNKSENYNINAKEICIQKVRLKAKAGLILVEYFID